MSERLMVALTEPSTVWSVLGNDTTNLDWTPISLSRQHGIQFDKADGAANTKLAGASRAVSVNLADYCEPHDTIVWPMIASALTNVAYAFCRVGTDASNYTEFRYADSSMTAGRWNLCKSKIGEGYVTGNGGNLSAVTYVAVGLAFDAEGDTLTDIIAGSVYIADTALTTT